MMNNRKISNRQFSQGIVTVDCQLLFQCGIFNGVFLCTFFKRFQVVTELQMTVGVNVRVLGGFLLSQ